MATATQVEVSTANAGVFHVDGITKASALKASQTLQDNHKKYHCFFNNSGMHNHIVHHILTIYALGATPEEIQKGYDDNKSYQRPAGVEEERIIQDLHDRKDFLKYMGREKYYVDFLQFFQSEIEQKGVPQVFQEYVFAGDEAADAMFEQLFSGFLHPIIHVGFGIEFSQPAIVAEGLAECAVSSKWLRPYFSGIREHLSTKAQPTTSKSLFDLISDVKANPDLVECVKFSDSSRLRDGVLARGAKPMIEIASQWRVTSPDQLEQKTAEMTSFAAYFAGAAQNPKKEVKFDFFFMHCVNSSIFFRSFLAQDWIPVEIKCKMLEMKGWVDLALYVAMHSPELYLDEITSYKAKDPTGDWQSVFKRAAKFEDDGHTSKFIRALASGHEFCQPWEEKEGWPIQGDMWLKLGHMVIDSVEGSATHWARAVGFPEAWDNFADR